MSHDSGKPVKSNQKECEHYRPTYWWGPIHNGNRITERRDEFPICPFCPKANPEEVKCQDCDNEGGRALLMDGTIQPSECGGCRREYPQDKCDRYNASLDNPAPAESAEEIGIKLLNIICVTDDDDNHTFDWTSAGKFVLDLIAQERAKTAEALKKTEEHEAHIDRMWNYKEELELQKKILLEKLAELQARCAELDHIRIKSDELHHFMKNYFLHSDLSWKVTSELGDALKSFDKFKSKIADLEARGKEKE